MPRDETPERAAVADRGEVAGDAADQHAVGAQHVDRADAEHQPGGERAERDADVVHHVETEHLQVGAAAAADVRIGRVVHLLELRQLGAAEQRVRQLRAQLQQHQQAQRRHVEQHRRQRHAAPLRADQPRETGQQKHRHPMPARRRRPVQHAVAMLHELLQPVGHLVAVAAAAGQRQVVADAPVFGGEIQRLLLPQRASRLAVQRMQPGLQAIPGLAVQGHEAFLFHARPSSQFTCATSCRIAAVSRRPVSGVSRLASSSWRCTVSWPARSA